MGPEVKPGGLRPSFLPLDIVITITLCLELPNSTNQCARQELTPGEHVGGTELGRTAFADEELLVTIVLGSLRQKVSRTDVHQIDG